MHTCSSKKLTKWMVPEVHVSCCLNGNFSIMSGTRSAWINHVVKINIRTHFNEVSLGMLEGIEQCEIWIMNANTKAKSKIKCDAVTIFSHHVRTIFACQWQFSILFLWVFSVWAIICPFIFIVNSQIPLLRIDLCDFDWDCIYSLSRYVELVHVYTFCLCRNLFYSSILIATSAD